MLGKWIIDGNHLAVDIKNEIHQLEANVIFSSIGNTEAISIDGVKCEYLQEAFPDSHFSKIGADIKCRLCFEDSDLVLKLFCVRGGITISVDVRNGCLVDHCFYDNEWFYLTGNIEEVNNIIRTLNLDDSLILNVAQYIKLKTICDTYEYTVVVEDVLFSRIDKKMGETDLPVGLMFPPFRYQSIGFAWMKKMLESSGGCILGDQMGLGKTFQIITVAQDMINRGETPILIISPVSLLTNWKNEFLKFAPGIKTFIHHGSKRTGWYEDLLKYDVIIIAYNTAISDYSLLRMINWRLAVVDEAQNIKNPYSQRTKFIKKIPRQSSIAMSGTPFENHITDIWSVADFAIPGVFGSLQQFCDVFSDDIWGAKKVEPLLTSMMIRRLVYDVASDLPEKIEIPQPVTMPNEEQIKYEEYRQEILKSVDKNHLNLMDIQKLRQFCTHPSVVTDEEVDDPSKESLKYQRLVELIDEIINNGEKVLVFTEFIKMFDILEKDLHRRYSAHFPVFKMFGGTEQEQRQYLVDSFNDKQGGAVFILNPTVAGAGFNITGANHVIHYTLLWNPAKEDQATARAYRRGQEKTVFVYRLYYENTVEQIINDTIQRKRENAEAAVIGTDGSLDTRQQLISALAISPIGGE